MLCFDRMKVEIYDSHNYMLNYAGFERMSGAALWRAVGKIILHFMYPSYFLATRAKINLTILRRARYRGCERIPAHNLAKIENYLYFAHTLIQSAIECDITFHRRDTN